MRDIKITLSVNGNELTREFRVEEGQFVREGVLEDMLDTIEKSHDKF